MTSLGTAACWRLHQHLLPGDSDGQHGPALLVPYLAIGP